MTGGPDDGRAPASGSLRLRLVIGGAAWILLALLAAGAFLSWQFRTSATTEFDRALGAQLERLTAALVVAPSGAVGLSEAPVDPRFREPYSGLYWQIGRGDAVLRSSRSLWDARLPLPDDDLRPGEVHRHTGPGPNGEPLVLMEQVVRIPGRAEGLRLTVGRDARELEAAIARFDRTLAVALGGLAAALGLALLLQVRVGLRPLARLRRALTRLGAGEAIRVEGRYPSEIAPAVDDLNAMLTRNETLIAGARRQAGDLAHALKTPLAVAATGLKPEDAEAARALEEMRRLIDHHTARARAVGGRTRVGLKTPLAPLLQRLAQALGRLHQDRGLSVAVQAPEGLAVAADPDDLNELVGALLDNACKWAAGRVRLSAAAEGGSVAIEIADDGPGVPQAARARVREAGQRLDESAPGTGLGLAIAGDLIALYGGEMRLADSDLGGLSVTVTLPRAGL
ncbi:MAG: HAMP domain-containing histidine kinase [Alphaproteobacteria bacterium]|nr:HAMP domain-containing histidine kinase [Alphaproteobacteria bacterium]